MKFLGNRCDAAGSSWGEGGEEKTGWFWRGTQRTGSLGVGDLRGSGVSSGSWKLNLIVSLSSLNLFFVGGRKSGRSRAESEVAMKQIQLKRRRT